MTEPVSCPIPPERCAYMTDQIGTRYRQVS
ncbi:protein of unknown function [Burkholderia multivorans]